MVNPRIRRCGLEALLIELDSLEQVDVVRTALIEAERDGRLSELAELVPAARTVLVSTRGKPAELDKIRELLTDLDPSRPVVREGREITIPTRYDGEDLELVARTAEIDTAEVIRLHAETTYTVAFCGFAPGFGYLSGLGESLRQPRLPTPRTTVPAGSVGVAGEFTAVYPRSSPGGWRLIGRTDVELFNPRRDPPALLAPGDRVRFEVRK